jgi:hypothetical protein
VFYQFLGDKRSIVISNEERNLLQSSLTCVIR